MARRWDGLESGCCVWVGRTVQPASSIRSIRPVAVPSGSASDRNISASLIRCRTIGEPRTSPCTSTSTKYTLPRNRLWNLNTEVIEIDAGVGSIELGFTGDWRQNARVSVDMGLGSLVLRFPRGLGVRLVMEDTFFTSLDSEGLVKRGDTYESLDYDDAEYQITVDVDAAFGSVRVVWVN